MKRPQTKRPRWKQWLFDIFQEFIAAREQASVWSTRRCPCCKTPAAAPDARFCAACGWSLDARGTPTTELLPIAPMPPTTSHPTRPLLAYLEQRTAGMEVGPRTQRHRAIHWGEKP